TSRCFFPSRYPSCNLDKSSSPLFPRGRRAKKGSLRSTLTSSNILLTVLIGSGGPSGFRDLSWFLTSRTNLSASLRSAAASSFRISILAEYSYVSHRRRQPHQPPRVQAGSFRHC